MMHFSNTVCFVVSVAGATKSFVVDASDARDVDQVLALAEEVESTGYGGDRHYHGGEYSAKTYGDYDASYEYGQNGYDAQSSYGSEEHSYGAKGYAPAPQYKSQDYGESSYGPRSEYHNYEAYGHHPRKEDYDAPSYGGYSGDHGGHNEYQEEYKRPQYYEPKQPEYTPTPLYTAYTPAPTPKPAAYVDPKKEAQEDFWRSVAQCQAGSRFTQCMLKCKGTHCFTGVSQYKKCTMQYANDVCKDGKMNVKDCKAFAFGNTMKYLQNMASNFIDAYLQKPNLASLSGTVKYSIAVKSVADEANCYAGVFWRFSKQCNSRGGIVSELDMEECMEESRKEISSIFGSPQWLDSLKKALQTPTSSAVKDALDSESTSRVANSMYNQFVGLLVDLRNNCDVLQIFNLSGGDDDDHDNGADNEENGKKETHELKLHPGCMRPINSQLPLGSYGLFRSQAAFTVPVHGIYPTTKSFLLSDIKKEPRANPKNISKKDQYKFCKNHYEMGKRMSETLGSSLATNELLEMNEYLLSLADGGYRAKNIDQLLQEDKCFAVDSWSVEYVGQNKEVTPIYEPHQYVKLPGFHNLNDNSYTIYSLDTIANYGKYYVKFDTLEMCTADLIKLKVHTACCKSFSTVAKEQNWDLPEPNYNAYRNSYGQDYHYGEKSYGNDYESQYYNNNKYGRYEGRSMAAGHYGGDKYSDNYVQNYGDNYGNNPYEDHWGFHHGYQSGYESMVADLVYSKVFISNKNKGYVMSKDVKASLKHKDTSMKLSDFMRHRRKCNSYLAGPILQDNVVCEDKMEAACSLPVEPASRVMPPGYHTSEYMYHDHDYEKKYEKKDKNVCLTSLQAKMEEVSECSDYKMVPLKEVENSPTRALPYVQSKGHHYPDSPKSKKELKCNSGADGWVSPDDATKCKIVHMPSSDDMKVALATKKKAFWCSSMEFACSKDSYHTSESMSEAEIMASLKAISWPQKSSLLEEKDAKKKVEKIKSWLGKKSLDTEAPRMPNLDWSLKQCKPTDFVQNECTAAMRAFNIETQLLDVSPADLAKGGSLGKTCFQDVQGDDANSAQALGRVLHSFASVALQRLNQLSFLWHLHTTGYPGIGGNKIMTHDVMSVFEVVVEGTNAFGGKDNAIELMNLALHEYEEAPSAKTLMTYVLQELTESSMESTDILSTHDIQKLAEDVLDVYAFANLMSTNFPDLEDKIQTIQEDLGELLDHIAPTEPNRVMAAYPGDGYQQQDYNTDYGHEYGASHDSYGKASTYGQGHYIVIDTSDDSNKEDCILGPRTTNEPTEVSPHDVRISDGYVSQKKMINEVCHDLGMGTEADEMIPISSNQNCAPTACYVARYFQCLENTEKRRKSHYGKYDSYESEYETQSQEEYYRTLLEQAQAQASPMELAGLASLGFVAGIATVALVQQGKGMMSKKRGQIASEHTNADQVQLV